LNIASGNTYGQFVSLKLVIANVLLCFAMPMSIGYFASLPSHSAGLSWLAGWHCYVEDALPASLRVSVAGFTSGFCCRACVTLNCIG